MRCGLSGAWDPEEDCDITFDPAILAEKPIIRGLRISVEMILELLAQGATEQEILQDYPQLEPDDLRAALAYAHRLGSTRTSASP